MNVEERQELIRDKLKHQPKCMKMMTDLFSAIDDDNSGKHLTINQPRNFNKSTNLSNPSNL